MPGVALVLHQGERRRERRAAAVRRDEARRSEVGGRGVEAGGLGEEAADLDVRLLARLEAAIALQPNLVGDDDREVALQGAGGCGATGRGDVRLAVYGVRREDRAIRE